MGQNGNINLFELPSLRMGFDFLICKTRMTILNSIRIKGDDVYKNFKNFQVLYYILGKA